jgi:hypothetical protein
MMNEEVVCDRNDLEMMRRIASLCGADSRGVFDSSTKAIRSIWIPFLRKFSYQRIYLRGESEPKVVGMLREQFPNRKYIRRKHPTYGYQWKQERSWDERYPLLAACRGSVRSSRLLLPAARERRTAGNGHRSD